ncbi:hypothetical protein MHPYR_530043 [uncultured Mycobacterium sp.]|uniref:Uncharacterized protein n=1 Tax=uncultured Mycobacterium sp. TaxID=171292 RepID=A0A1Y5PHQ1_9MYCO|nr:hypothetical protein MHPYR_530043 [uncultured Mycobacterium sp.]
MRAVPDMLLRYQLKYLYVHDTTRI